MDQTDHLSAQQLRELAGGSDPLDAAHPAAEHLMACSACHQILAMSRRTEQTRQELQAAGYAPLSGECLSAMQLGELATGLTPPDVARIWLEHVATCDACGIALASITSDVQSTPNPAEESLIESLKSSNPLWQHNFAQRLAACESEKHPVTRRTETKSFSSRRTWIPLTVAASLAVAAIAGWRVLPSYRASRVETLLAQAYTQQRPFDFRLADDGYSPVTQLRAGAVSAFDRPESLLAAQSRLATEKPSVQANARWLRLRANAELLDLNPDAAIAELDHARQLDPKNVDVLVDLAIAHAVRGDAESRPVDFAAALDLLTEAVRVDPQSKRALFNRGLVLERLLLLDEAARDFRKYLEIEQSGGWADEVKKRLQDLEQRRSGRDSRHQRMRSGPIAFLGALHAHDPPAIDAWLDRSVLSWLSQPPSPETTKALEELSTRLVSLHREHWVQSLLQELPYPNSAYESLFQLVEANISGDATDAMRLAEEAVASPAIKRSNAALLRARYERVYALHRALKPEACRDEAASLLSSLKGRDFQWITAQTRAELAICTGMLGDEGTAIRILYEAENEATALGMQATALRVRGVRVGTQTSAGDPWTIWKEGPAILRQYWVIECSPNRLQQVAFKLSDASSAIGFPSAAYIFAEAAANALTATPNRLAEAVNRVAVASLARQAGFVDEGLAELKRAKEIFASLKSTDTAIYSYSATLDEAETYVLNRQFDQALRSMEPLKAGQSEPPTFLLSLKLRQVSALAQMGLGDLTLSSQELDKGIELLRARMGSLSSPRERLRIFETSASLYRARAEVEISRGNPDGALRLLLELYGSPGGALPDLGGRSLLVCDSLPSGPAAWLVAGNRIKFHRPQTSGDALASSVRTLREMAADPSSAVPEIQALSRGIYDRLLSPLFANDDVPQQLVILASGPMKGVPFHLLALPDNRYLEEAAAITYATRLGRSWSDPLRVDASKRALVGLSPSAPARLGVRLPTLKDAFAEAAHVASLFNESELLRGPSLTADTLKERAASAELFHFSGHGFSQAGSGSLLLPGANDLPLTSTRISAMNWMRCSLAVLSACLTATGETHSSVNPDSLVQAFLTAGAKGVLAASWSIDSASTRRLMENFYDNLAKGQPADAALRLAASQLKATPSYAHPYHWGAFQLYR